MEQLFAGRDLFLNDLPHDLKVLSSPQSELLEEPIDVEPQGNLEGNRGAVGEQAHGLTLEVALLLEALDEGPDCVVVEREVWIVAGQLLGDLGHGQGVALREDPEDLPLAGREQILASHGAARGHLRVLPERFVVRSSTAVF